MSLYIDASPPLNFEMKSTQWKRFFQGNTDDADSLQKTKSGMLHKLGSRIVSLTTFLKEKTKSGVLFPDQDIFEDIMEENIRDVLTKSEREERNGIFSQKKQEAKNNTNNVTTKTSKTSIMNKLLRKKLGELQKLRTIPFTAESQVVLETDKKVMSHPMIDVSKRKLLMDKVVANKKKKLHQQELMLSDEEKKNLQILFPTPRNLQQVVAQTSLQRKGFLPAIVPELLKFTLRDDKPRLPVKNFYSIKAQIQKKYTLAHNPDLSCFTCGQTGHSKIGCWLHPLTCDQLQSTDPRDSFLINFFERLPNFEKLEPPNGVIELEWLLDHYWPTLLDREQKIFEKLETEFAKAFPGNTFLGYLEKFKVIFSRLWWGTAFSHALSLNKNTTLRSALGIPRHNSVETPNIEVLQKRSAEIEKIIHAMHEKKVTEGKLLKVPEWLPTAIYAIFNIQESDKVRMITDALHDNVTYPKQSVKMTKISDLFFYANGVISLALDILSAYDQVPSTPRAMLHQGATSKDEFGRSHYYVWTGLCQGKTPGPRRCQGHFNFLLDPVRKFFSAIKLYIDDILTISDRSDLSMTDNIILHKSFLLILHKLGIRLSPKAYPELTTTPKYLGYLMDFENKKAYPQSKHLFKLANIIFDILDAESPTTFRQYLQLKGVACFCLGHTASFLFQNFDNFIKYQYHVKQLKVENILTMKMPPNPQLWDIIQQIIALLGDLDRITFGPKLRNSDVKHQVILVTDANCKRAGGFCLVNGKTVDLEKLNIPLFGQSTQMEDLNNDYRYKVFQHLKNSTTDEERAAALFTVQNILPKLPRAIPGFQAKNAELILLTDNKPLYYQENKILNTSARANHEIKKLRTLCYSFCSRVSFLWHPRTTVEADIADSYTRDEELTIGPKLFNNMSEFFQKPDFQAPLSMKKLASLQIFDPDWIVNTDIRDNSTLLLFPNPMMANKQFETVFHFIKQRRLNGVIILPEIGKFKKFLGTRYFKRKFSLGKIQSPNFYNIPKKLKSKKFNLIAIEFEFDE